MGRFETTWVGIALFGGCSGDRSPTGLHDPYLVAYAVRMSVCTGSPAGAALGRVLQGLAVGGPALRVALHDQVDCVRGAADCPAVLACLDLGERCDAESTLSACEGDTTRTSCSSQPNGEAYVERISCPAVGGPVSVCRLAPNEDEDIHPSCVGAPCDVEGVSRCEGDFVVECIGGYERRRACVLAGQTCLEIEEGLHACGESAGCSGDACVDGVALRCDRESGVPRVDGRLDCRVYSARHDCVMMDEGPGCRPNAPDPACAGDETRESCDGAVIRACLEGLEVALDCATFGARCAVAEEPHGRSQLRCLAPDWP
jgi:hypothetical protein